MLISISEGGPGCGAAPSDRADGFTAARGSQQAIRSLPGRRPTDIPSCADAPFCMPGSVAALLVVDRWLRHSGWPGSVGVSASAHGAWDHFPVPPEERAAFSVPGVYDRPRNGRAA